MTEVFNSVDHPSWEEQPVFRELFLVHAPPMAAASLREAGRHFYDAVLESGLPETGVPWVHSRLQALARDLRFTAQVLTSVAAEPEEVSLGPEERALAMKGGAWGREVADLANALGSAVGHSRENR